MTGNTDIERTKQVLLNPALYARTCLRIKDKYDKVVPFVYNRAQAHYMQNRTPFDLLVKARQLGFSTLIQGEFNRKQNTSPARCITLSDTDNNTRKLRRIAKRFIDEWAYPDTKPIIGEDNAGYTTFSHTGAESAIVTAGATTGGRGGTYRYMHGSEVAWWRDADVVLPAVLEAIPLHGRAVLESTTNGAQGAFYNLVQESLSGKNKWATHFYAWWWDDEYRIPLEYPDEIKPTDEEKHLMRVHMLDLEQIKFRRDKQVTLKHQFLQEYPEDITTCFLVSGIGYFGNLSDAIYKAPLDAQPIGDHSYIAGLDFGQSNDYTVLCVVDTVTGCQVDMLRINRMAWELQYQQIANVCKRWGIWAIMADSTGMQQAQIQRLSDVLYEHGLEVTVQGYPFDSKSKPLLISGLHEALYHGHIILQNHPVQRQEFTQFIAKQSTTGHWQYTAPSGAHDDTVIASALALYAMRAVTKQHEAVLI